MDTDCINQRKFLNLVDTFNFTQNVNKSTHLHGHTLGLILSPSESSFVSNVTAGDLLLDPVSVKCHLDFACPTIPKVNNISYCRYIIKSTCRAFARILQILTSPARMAADLYDKYICDLGGALDRHAPLICQRVNEIPAEGCLIHNIGPNLLI